jgi:hypothetical protein
MSEYLKAIASAILTTMICGLNNTSKAFDNIDEITFNKVSAEKYLEMPIINPKTGTYHARIYVQCMKTLFIILKNKELMGWLMKEHIYLEENDLEMIVPTNVGVIFYIHPRASLNSIHHHHSYLISKDQKFQHPKLKCGRVKIRNMRVECT